MAVAVRTIELRLFGEPVLLLDGEAVSFSGFPRLPAMLAHLALHDAPVRRDQLAFSLWPDETESSARANLRRSLHRLQNLIGPEENALYVSNTSLALNRQAIAADVWEFEALLARPDADSLARAIELYRTGLFPSCEDEWLAPLRNKMRDRLLAAIAQALELAERSNDTAAVQLYARKMLALEPFREDALRKLMTSQAESGDRAGALAEYRAFKERLHEEFAVDPDADTVAVYESLAKRENARRTHNLPFESDPFIGRDAELVQIARAFEARREVTVCGAPGVGKSRLALHYAHTQRSVLEQAWYVQLAPAHDRDTVLDAMLAVLRIRQEPREPAFDALCRALKDGETLILFDTAERVVEPLGELVSELLAQCARARFLVSSREPLKIPSEAVVRLEPLAVDDAKRLFADRARAAAGSALPLAPAAVEALCEALEGIPLALELAAARAAFFPVEDIVLSLKRDLSTLRAPRRALPAHHKTLDETIAWSYALLNDTEKRCLRALALFPETWSLEAGLAICDGNTGEIEGAIASLVDKSFAHPVHGRSGRRYALYQSVRFFGDAHAGDERVQSKSNFLRYYRDLAQEVVPALADSRQAATLEMLQDERSNIDTVLREADRTNAPWAAEFALALYRYWLTRGSYTDALHWMERFSGTAQSASVKARCCAAAAVLATLLGEVKRAADFLACADACEALDDAALLEVHHAAGIVAHERGDLRGARDEILKSLEHARRAGDESKVARALDNLGALEAILEDFGTARTSLEESLAIYRRAGNMESIAWVLYHLAGLAFRDSDYEKAIALNDECFKIRRSLGHSYGIALCHEGMAKARLALGDVGEAKNDYLQALVLCHEAKQRSAIAVVLDGLAAVAVHEERYERAGLLCEAATRLRNDLAIELRAYEQELPQRYQSQALLRGAAAFEAGKARARTLAEERCIEIALRDADA